MKNNTVILLIMNISINIASFFYLASSFKEMEESLRKSNRETIEALSTALLVMNEQMLLKE